MDTSEPTSIDFIQRQFGDDGRIPNNLDLPLILYPGAFSGCDSDEIANRFQQNKWHGCWVNGVFSWHHYHSTAHEVLGCFSGSARVQFGGEEGETFEIKAGDAVIIPAGVGHKNLGASSDFGVVGAYPNGQHHDMGSGESHERPRVLENIRHVSRPESDPVFGGSDTPLMRLWCHD